MHLHCRTHKRRVVVLDTNTVHRSDGSACEHAGRFDGLQIGARMLSDRTVKAHADNDGYIPPSTFLASL